MINQTYSLRSTSLRDALSIAFRRKRLIIGCLAATVVAAVLAALILPVTTAKQRSWSIGIVSTRFCRRRRRQAPLQWRHSQSLRMRTSTLKSR